MRRACTSWIVGWFLFLMLGGLCRSAGATPTLDQNFTPPDDSTTFIGEGFAYVAQTVTPGITGALTQARLNASRFSSYSGLWGVSVRTVNGSGQPTSTILASQTLTAADVPDQTNPGITIVNFSSPPMVTAGTPFALVINPDPAVSGGGQGKGSWRGRSNSGGVHYDGGAPYHSNDGASFALDFNGQYDLDFQTYVDPAIPEPAIGASLMVIPFVGLLRRRRSRCDR